MTDKTVRMYNPISGDIVPALYHDNGDGTYSLALGGPLPAGVNNIGDVDIASIAAGESHIGQVGGHAAIVAAQAVCDTNAYGAGDVLFIPQLMTNVVRVAAGTALLDMVRVIDLDDQGGALDLLYFSALPGSIGTINGAMNISDDDALKMIGWVRVLATDYEDWGGFRTATIRRGDSGMKASILKPDAGRDLYIAGISRDTKTYTASGLRIYHYLLQD